MILPNAATQSALPPLPPARITLLNKSGDIRLINVATSLSGTSAFLSLSISPLISRGIGCKDLADKFSIVSEVGDSDDEEDEENEEDEVNEEDEDSEEDNDKEDDKDNEDEDDELNSSIPCFCVWLFSVPSTKLMNQSLLS